MTISTDDACVSYFIEELLGRNSGQHRLYYGDFNLSIEAVRYTEPYKIEIYVNSMGTGNYQTISRTKFSYGPYDNIEEISKLFKKHLITLLVEKNLLAGWGNNENAIVL